MLMLLVDDVVLRKFPFLFLTCVNFVWSAFLLWCPIVEAFKSETFLWIQFLLAQQLLL